MKLILTPLTEEQTNRSCDKKYWRGEPIGQRKDSGSNPVGLDGWRG